MIHAGMRTIARLAAIARINPIQTNPLRSNILPPESGGKTGAPCCRGVRLLPFVIETHETPDRLLRGFVVRAFGRLQSLMALQELRLSIRVALLRHQTLRQISANGG